ncbi:Pre-mRNA-splicing factor ATP-dependent RNA helicase-like protein PRP2 [Frankliniella fusca]|uniref:Pre-mRNA-splicing factor ATP-dependent RNA helicase-like protein PRP2 n=1 Tax=Frankliniella fusca TaxID=407009 RepID=A0AAE1H101_9NEOP|nr:Pre-mRNA-splicing factor ATP-dependent RNA helicase-like protein PRP2 [Frankliniella fusca]
MDVCKFDLMAIQFLNAGKKHFKTILYVMNLSCQCFLAEKNDSVGPVDGNICEYLSETLRRKEISVL